MKYKVEYKRNIEKTIDDEGLNIEVINDLLNKEMKKKQDIADGDIIFTLDIRNKKIALLGTLSKNKITINYLSTNPIIVNNI